MKRKISLSELDLKSVYKHLRKFQNIYKKIIEDLAREWIYYNIMENNSRFEMMKILSSDGYYKSPTSGFMFSTTIILKLLSDLKINVARNTAQRNLDWLEHNTLLTSEIRFTTIGKEKFYAVTMEGLIVYQIAKKLKNKGLK